MPLKPCDVLPSRMPPPPEHLSDTDLVVRCQAGDHNAWAEFVRRFGRLVYSVPTRMGLPPEACDDVFQDVFEIAVRTLPAVKDPKSVPKWLLTVAYHAVCRRGRRSRDRVSSREDEHSDPPPDDLDRWERAEIVRRAMARLGGNCERLLMALFRRPEGGGYDGIATQTGIPVGSIGPTRGRCLRKLLAILEDMGVADEF